MPKQRTRTPREIINDMYAAERENINTDPIEIPAGLIRPPTLHEELARFIKTEVAQAARANDYEDFEEGDDFDEEDPDLMDFTPYELHCLDNELGQPIDNPEAPQETKDSQPIPTPTPEAETASETASSPEHASDSTED